MVSRPAEAIEHRERGMAPKVVSLALAGKRLSAPPEPYGPRKQLQIKGWLRTVQLIPYEAEVGSEDLQVGLSRPN